MLGCGARAGALVELHALGWSIRKSPPHASYVVIFLHLVLFLLPVDTTAVRVVPWGSL